MEPFFFVLCFRFRKKFLDFVSAVLGHDSRAGGRLVDEVDGLVGQETIGDVAGREFYGRFDRLVGDLYAVVLLIFGAQTFENGYGVGFGGLLHVYGGEAPFESAVLFDIFSVFLDGGGADDL